MIIDCHQHVVLPVADQLALMDEAGIDRSVLLSTVPHVERAHDLASYRSEMVLLQRVLSGEGGGSRMPAEELAASLRAGGSRFIGFGKVPVGLSQEETGEALQAEVIGPGLAGVGELTFGGGQAHLMEAVFRAVSDSPDGPGGPRPILVHGFLPQTLDDLRETARLARAHPRIPVIIGVLGGLNWLETIELVRDSANLYLDLASSFVSLAPRLATVEIPERSLFGSNTPFADAFTNRTLIERLVADPGVRRRVMGENLAELLGISG